MATRNFCDACGKEIEGKKINTIQMDVYAMGSDQRRKALIGEPIEHDICNSCFVDIAKLFGDTK